jgi:hypothetical protein
MEKDRLTPDHTAYHYTMDAGRGGSGPMDGDPEKSWKPGNMVGKYDRSTILEIFYFLESFLEISMQDSIVFYSQI